MNQFIIERSGRQTLLGAIVALMLCLFTAFVGAQPAPTARATAGNAFRATRLFQDLFRACAESLEPNQIAECIERGQCPPNRALRAWCAAPPIAITTLTVVANLGSAQLAEGVTRDQVTTPGAIALANYASLEAHCQIRVATDAGTVADASADDAGTHLVDRVVQLNQSAMRSSPHNPLSWFPGNCETAKMIEVRANVGLTCPANPHIVRPTARLRTAQDRLNAATTPTDLANVLTELEGHEVFDDPRAERASADQLNTTAKALIARVKTWNGFVQENLARQRRQFERDARIPHEAHARRERMQNKEINDFLSFLKLWIVGVLILAIARTAFHYGKKSKAPTPDPDGSHRDTPDPGHRSSSNPGEVVMTTVPNPAALNAKYDEGVTAGKALMTFLDPNGIEILDQGRVNALLDEAHKRGGDEAKTAGSTATSIAHEAKVRELEAERDGLATRLASLLDAFGLIFEAIFGKVLAFNADGWISDLSATANLMAATAKGHRLAADALLQEIIAFLKELKGFANSPKKLVKKINEFLAEKAAHVTQTVAMPAAQSRPVLVRPDEAETKPRATVARDTEESPAAPVFPGGEGVPASEPTRTDGTPQALGGSSQSLTPLALGYKPVRSSDPAIAVATPPGDGHDRSGPRLTQPPPADDAAPTEECSTAVKP